MMSSIARVSLGFSPSIAARALVAPQFGFSSFSDSWQVNPLSLEQVSFKPSLGLFGRPSIPNVSVSAPHQPQTFGGKVLGVSSNQAVGASGNGVASPDIKATRRQLDTLA